MAIIKIILAICFVLTGGNLFSKSFRKSKFLTIAAAFIAIISSYYLIQEMYDDIIKDTFVLPLPNVSSSELKVEKTSELRVEKISELKVEKTSELRVEKTSELKVEKTSLSEQFPKGLNILIFNASSDSKAHINLKKEFLGLVPTSKIDAQKEWMNSWLMAKTRIYYLGSKNKKTAEIIANRMPGDQDVINYYKQLNDDYRIKFPDKPLGKSSKMVGINAARDIVIFIGEDISQLEIRD